jgi:hypothetical protein
METNPCSHPHAWGGRRLDGEQDENGVDLSIIRENLKLTPTERIRRASAAAEGMLPLRKCGGRWLEEHARDLRRAVAS